MSDILLSNSDLCSEYITHKVLGFRARLRGRGGLLLEMVMGGSVWIPIYTHSSETIMVGDVVQLECAVVEWWYVFARPLLLF